MMVMQPIHKQATAATGRDMALRLKGPFMLTKFLCQMRPMRIGRPYEMYSPMVAMEVAAAKATDDPRLGSERIKARTAASQTARMGDLKRASTLWKKEG